MTKTRSEVVEQGFLDVLSLHQNLINRVIRIYARDSEDRRDLFQEIVYQLWRSYRSFRGESNVSTWLYRVALNTAITALRKSTRKPEQEELKHEVIASLQSHESPDKSEQTQLLYLAIKSLGEVDRALVMLYLEDLSYKEIADVLGLTEDNVGVKLNRIKSKLRVFIGHIE
jgi:RNA polymerase sigma-70 factor (ECF subfamily)